MESFARSALALLLLPVAVALSSCSGAGAPTSSTSVLAVKVTPINPTVEGGAALTFLATAVLQNGESRDVTDDPGTSWDSSNQGVVSINADGTGTANSPGESYISAEVDGIRSPAQKVVVTAPATPTPTPTPAPTANHVVISEVLYNPTVDPGGEFIELFNPTGAPISLDGSRLAFDGGATTYFTFPAATTIAASGYVVVCNTPATCGVAGSFDSTSNVAFPDTTGEWIVLLNVAGVTTADQMAYGTGNTGTKPLNWCTGSTPAANAALDNSVQRKPVGSDGDTCTDWISNTPATPLAPPP